MVCPSGSTQGPVRVPSDFDNATHDVCRVQQQLNATADVCSVQHLLSATADVRSLQNTIVVLWHPLRMWKILLPQVSGVLVETCVRLQRHVHAHVAR
jgi:hypothetical protein